MTRTSDAHVAPSNSSILPLPRTSEVVTHLPPEGAPSCTHVPQALAETAESVKTPEAGEAPASATSVARPAKGPQSGIEPSLLISIPVICHAFKEGWLERESLIFAKKDAYNNVSWGKPLEIIKDHNEEGIRNILNTIGQKRVLEFMSKEGVRPALEASVDDFLAGKGYTMEREKLIALYDKYVAGSCDEIFPFVLKQVGIARGRKGEFLITKGREASKEDGKTAEQEWMMPNLANLPTRTAVEKLMAHTPNIKVYGTGRVMSQSPRPFERIRGETACVIQGKGVAE